MGDALHRRRRQRSTVLDAASHCCGTHHRSRPTRTAPPALTTRRRHPRLRPHLGGARDVGIPLKRTAERDGTRLRASSGSDRRSSSSSTTPYARTARGRPFLGAGDRRRQTSRRWRDGSGHQLGEIRPAVQPGRRIATLAASAGSRTEVGVHEPGAAVDHRGRALRSARWRPTATRRVQRRHA